MFLFFFSFLFLAPSFASAKVSSESFSELGFPESLSKTRLRGLLQDFVNTAYRKGFKYLGEERDFDHGHLLFSEKTGEPVAILYHTQELFSYRRIRPAGLDPGARNWIQWLAGGVENASRYQRQNYPSTPAWEWFKKRELPRLEKHRTITVKMLDPELLGGDIHRSMQWSFRRRGCPASKTLEDENSRFLDVVLPGNQRICLSLSSSK